MCISLVKHLSSTLLANFSYIVLSTRVTYVLPGTVLRAGERSGKQDQSFCRYGAYMLYVICCMLNSDKC